MRFLLIITTLDRTSELRRFLDSACGQTYKYFEIVIVDQNGDDRVARVLEEFAGRLSISHIPSDRQGASSGRNTGLKFLSDADFIAFPDDDCWYPPNLLARVAEFFRLHPEWGGLTGRSVTEQGLPSNGRWHSRSGPVTLQNAWNRATCFSMFFRSMVARQATFDESLGGGSNTPWGGGEDLDFLLQIIASGNRVFFDPSLTVYHPEWSTAGYTASVRTKALSYARGMGRVLRKHSYPVYLVGYQVIRALGGSVLALLKGRSEMADYHWVVMKGRLQGWAAPLPLDDGAVPLREPATLVAEPLSISPTIPAFSKEGSRASQATTAGKRTGQ